MRLFYCRHFSWNFGDELNPWLWQKALPIRFDHGGDGWLFVGIGTILNWPMMHRKVAVLGAGLGYGEVSASWIQHAARHWRFYCVRGPMTARRLGIDAALAITDPGILVHKYFPAEPAGTKSVALVPHWLTAFSLNDRLSRVCLELGYRMVDPCEPVDSVLEAIAGSELVLAESLHGAIVADAFRVPWTPIAVRQNPHTSAFKWEDWCASVKVPYAPQPLDLTADVQRVLRRLPAAAPRCLSSERVLTDRSRALEEAIDRFVRDYNASAFETSARQDEACVGARHAGRS